MRSTKIKTELNGRAEQADTRDLVDLSEWLSVAEAIGELSKSGIKHSAAYLHQLAAQYKPQEAGCPFDRQQGLRSRKIKSLLCLDRKEVEQYITWLLARRTSKSQAKGRKP